MLSFEEVGSTLLNFSWETWSQETCITIYGLEAADYSVLEKSRRYRMTEEDDLVRWHSGNDLFFFQLKEGQ